MTETFYITPQYVEYMGCIDNYTLAIEEKKLEIESQLVLSTSERPDIHLIRWSAEETIPQIVKDRKRNDWDWKALPFVKMSSPRMELIATYRLYSFTTTPATLLGFYPEERNANLLGYFLCFRVAWKVNSSFVSTQPTCYIDELAKRFQENSVKPQWPPAIYKKKHHVAPVPAQAFPLAPEELIPLVKTKEEDVLVIEACTNGNLAKMEMLYTNNIWRMNSSLVVRLMKIAIDHGYDGILKWLQEKWNARFDHPHFVRQLVLDSSSGKDTTVIDWMISQNIVPLHDVVVVLSTRSSHHESSSILEYLWNKYCINLSPCEKMRYQNIIDFSKTQ
jgi:hypothetical protein